MRYCLSYGKCREQLYFSGMVAFPRTMLMLCLLCSPLITLAQYEHKEKYNCVFSEFCLDCGDEGHEAMPPDGLEAFLRTNLPAEKIKLASGGISLQVLVDTLGKPCVLFVDYQTDRKIPSFPFDRLMDKFGTWRPATINGKPETICTILVVHIDKGAVTLSREINKPQPGGNRYSVGTPEFTNRKFRNTAVPLKMEVFQKANSEIPMDMSRAVAVDHNNVIWYGTDNGIVRIKDGIMMVFDHRNTSLPAPSFDFTVSSVNVDAGNRKWIVEDDRVYSYDDTSWTYFDTLSTGLGNPRKVYSDLKGNVWLMAGDGLARYDGNSWQRYDSVRYQLPSNNISGVLADSRGRIWIGTYKGNVMVGDGEVHPLGRDNSPLGKASITSGFEDPYGNLWFTLYSHDKTAGGLAKLDAKGNWTHYGITDSGSPTDSYADILVDKQGKLWLAGEGAGLITFDGKSWSAYTPANSKVPSTILSQLAQDQQGNIWAATFYGLVKIYGGKK